MTEIKHVFVEEKQKNNSVKENNEVHYFRTERGIVNGSANTVQHKNGESKELSEVSD